MKERVAESFLSMGIQHWGQSAEERKKVTDDYLVAAGFNLEAELAAAEEWVSGVVRNLRRGEFYDEVEQLRRAIETRKAA